jgi:hypothetical protein
MPQRGLGAAAAAPLASFLLAPAATRAIDQT